MKECISISGVSKSYGRVEALKEVSLRVNSGEIFGLVGPDGAGKTTLFRILTTLLLPDQGVARVSGYDVVQEFKHIRQTVGYMPGRFSLYQDLSVDENLHFFASLFGSTVTQNYDLIADIYDQLSPFKDRRAGKLSGGMKQKLALCCALIHRPRVLFLDEPTTGVDPVSRAEFWQMLKRLKQQGITIMVSTPYMDEASWCDRIAFIEKGQILTIGTPSEIIADYQGELIQINAPQMYDLLLAARQWEGAASCYAFGDAHHVLLKHSYTVGQLRDFLFQLGFTDLQIMTIEPSIEDCFMTLSL